MVISKELARLQESRLFGGGEAPRYMIAGASTAEPGVLAKAVPVTVDEARKNWPAIRRLIHLDDMPFKIRHANEPIAILRRSAIDPVVAQYRKIVKKLKRKKRTKVRRRRT